MELVVPATTTRPTTLISSIPDHPPTIRRSKTDTFPLRISISCTKPRVSRKVSSFSQPAVVAVSAVASISSCSKWMVVMERPHGGLVSKSEVVDFYVETLAKVLGSEKEAQMCIYDVSWQTHFGFCCDIDKEASTQLAGLPGVLSVRPDKDADSISKDYSFTSSLMGHLSTSIGRSSKFSPSLPGESSQHWLVQMEKPRVEVVTKAQIVDYYAQTLTKVLGNEMDAQVSIYSISWENEFGFCCQIDEDCAQELAAVPGVLTVRPDMNFDLENKDYKGVAVGKNLMDSSTTSDSNQTPKTKRLFVTGLSFYTSEKTLRGAFEGYGELVEVKIIMDKISKRSKGYAFIEYTTEDAASAALKEMNGKIINGWMIVVDVARTKPPRYNRAQSRPSSRHTYSN